MVEGILKMNILPFFGDFFFTILLNFAKKINICKFEFLFAEHKSFPMMYHLSYLYIKHGI